MKKFLTGVALVASLAGGGLLLGTAPASAAQLGGINVQGYCEKNRGIWPRPAVAIRNPSDAYSWRCNYAGANVGVDMNLACRQQYPNSRPAAWAKPLNPKDAFSWRCYN